MLSPGEAGGGCRPCLALDWERIVNASNDGTAEGSPPHADPLPEGTRWLGGFHLTSLALSCVSNMVGRGRELQGEWPRSLYADHASFSA